MHTQKSNLNKFRAKIFKALSDPIRLEIIQFLHREEKCVCEIIPHLCLIQPVVSRHFKILRDSGMVRDRKEGNRRLYSITDHRVYRIIDDVTPELVNTLTKQMIEQIT